MVLEGYLCAFDFIGGFGEEAGRLEVGLFERLGGATVLGWRFGAVVEATE